MLTSNLVNMENEHWSVSRVPNCHIIIIVNSPGTQKIFTNFSLSFPHTIFDRKGFVYHQWLVAGTLSPGGTQQIFTRIIPAPRSMSLHFHIPFLTEKVLLSYTIPSLLAVEGWGGLLQAFYPQGVLKNFLRG